MKRFLLVTLFCASSILFASSFRAALKRVTIFSFLAVGKSCQQRSFTATCSYGIAPSCLDFDILRHCAGRCRGCSIFAQHAFCQNHCYERTPCSVHPFQSEVFFQEHYSSQEHELRGFPWFFRNKALAGRRELSKSRAAR